MLPNVGGEHYAEVLEAAGFSRDVASPCLFFHKGLQTYILVHGEEFFIMGRREGRNRALSLPRSAYELSKVVTPGPQPSQSRTASFLGRTLTLRQWGIESEPDQQHVSRALKPLGLTLLEPMTWVGPRPAKSASCVERQNGTILGKKSERKMIFPPDKN